VCLEVGNEFGSRRVHRALFLTGGSCTGSIRWRISLGWSELEQPVDQGEIDALRRESFALLAITVVMHVPHESAATRDGRGAP
jgi:hypothetical protein